MNTIEISVLRTYKQIMTNMSTVETFPFLDTFISLLVNKTIKDPNNISISLKIIPIRK